MRVILLQIFLAAIAAEPFTSDNTQPDPFYISWEKGIHSVKEGQIKRGLMSLESLRTARESIEDSLLFQYAQLVSASLLPRVKNVKPDTVFTNSYLPQSILDIYIRDEELVSQNQSWNVNHLTGTDLPVFTYSMQFNLKEQFKLQFPFLISVNKPALVNNINSKYRESISEPLVFNPDAPPWEIHLKIVIDCTSKQPSLADYLCNIVCNKYDVIKEKKEDFLKNSLSLRCYNRQVFSRMPGKFLAFVAFDRLCSRVSIDNKKPVVKNNDQFMVRYLVAVEANRSVEGKVEKILRNILESFKG